MYVNMWDVNNEGADGQLIFCLYCLFVFIFSLERYWLLRPKPYSYLTFVYISGIQNVIKIHYFILLMMSIFSTFKKQLPQQSVSVYCISSYHGY